MKYCRDLPRAITGRVKMKEIEGALQPFMTSRRLLDQGICLCDECGKLCSTDYKWCSVCNRQVLILESIKTEKRYWAKKQQQVKL